MIQLSGAGEDEIPIRIVGSRAGEKLFEELRTDAEDIRKTDLRKILLCEPLPIEGARIDTTLERLRFAVHAKDADGIRESMRELAIGYEDQLHPARMPTDGEA
jgi:FlaA1/EpsC-like NDP-sugar epimerase